MTPSQVPASDWRSCHRRIVSRSMTQPTLTPTSLFPLVSSSEKYGCGHSTQLLLLLNMKPDQRQFDVSILCGTGSPAIVSGVAWGVSRTPETSPPFIVSVSNRSVAPLVVRWHDQLHDQSCDHLLVGIAGYKS